MSINFNDWVESGTTVNIIFDNGSIANSAIILDDNGEFIDVEMPNGQRASFNKRTIDVIRER